MLHKVTASIRSAALLKDFVRPQERKFHRRPEVQSAELLEGELVLPDHSICSSHQGSDPVYIIQFNALTNLWYVVHLCLITVALVRRAEVLLESGCGCG